MRVDLLLLFSRQETRDWHYLVVKRSFGGDFHAQRER